MMIDDDDDDSPTTKLPITMKAQTDQFLLALHQRSTTIS
jgi:hypothetical protein